MAGAQLKRTDGAVLGAAKPRRDVERDRAASVRAPRRPACADSFSCSRDAERRARCFGRLG
jgi:hypothetical protein